MLRFTLVIYVRKLKYETANALSQVFVNHVFYTNVLLSRACIQIVLNFPLDRNSFECNKGLSVKSFENLIKGDNFQIIGW